MRQQPPTSVLFQDVPLQEGLNYHTVSLLEQLLVGEADSKMAGARSSQQVAHQKHSRCRIQREKITQLNCYCCCCWWWWWLWFWCRWWFYNQGRRLCTPRTARPVRRRSRNDGEDIGSDYSGESPPLMRRTPPPPQQQQQQPAARQRAPALYLFLGFCFEL